MNGESLDSFKSRGLLKAGGKSYEVFRLSPLLRMPFSIRILLENLLRNEDGKIVKPSDIEALRGWSPTLRPESSREIAFHTARVLLQDFTGVPAVVDLAAMREVVKRFGGDPAKVNPLQPADLVIDHSVQVDFFGSRGAFQKNAALELERNRERYLLLRWASQAFRNFRVVPPETGIVHQVNLEYLARVVFSQERPGRAPLAFPDTLVGTDSHTTMINGLGVVGWGVGGIEAEACMLGLPISMMIPEVIGFKLVGEMPPGTTATDLVLTATQMLRAKGVVEKFVEFYGPGLSHLTLPDRATIANMAPEYGATIGFFPVDEETLVYLRLTGRPAGEIALVEAYCKEQGLFRTDATPDPQYSDTLELDLSTVVPSLAGPRRPQDRVPLKNAKASFRKILVDMLESHKDKPNAVRLSQWLAEGGNSTKLTPELKRDHQLGHIGARVQVKTDGESFELRQGSVVIAAITSCTNTSNPAVMIGAGLLARKAAARGLKVQPWVKTSLAPGSKVVMDYLEKSGLMKDLEKLNFHLVGYGCTTCIGNSGPLSEPVARAIKENELVCAAVLSGNRNFEGRINPHVRANYLASPPLVVAYALAGQMDTDLYHEPLGEGSDGKPVYLKDIWPLEKEIEDVMRTINAKMFSKQYADVFKGDALWQKLKIPKGNLFQWDAKSTYVKNPPFFDGMEEVPAPSTDIVNARVLGMFGDSVTTDHISPAGDIANDSPAGKYLIFLGVKPEDFNSYGARRGNHEVMMRGTFANIRIKNLLLPGTEGGVTRYFPDGEKMPIYDAAMKYQNVGARHAVPLLVIAGKEYGTGSSRDWAAKGTRLLGVRAVIAESFERIHRSNLVGMGVLPLQFQKGGTAQSLGLTGEETYSIDGIAKDLTPGKVLTVIAKPSENVIARSGEAAMKQSPQKTFRVTCRIDTPQELEYYRHGGILPYVVRQLLK